LFPKKRFGRKKGNFKAFISLVVIIVFLIYGFMYLDTKVKPSVLAIAEVKASVTLSPLFT